RSTAVRFWMDTLAHKALESRQATFAFTCYDCTAALALVTGAEAAAPSIILLVRPAVAAGATRGFDAALRRRADATGTPISTQLHYATNPHLMHGAIAVETFVAATDRRSPYMKGAQKHDEQPERRQKRASRSSGRGRSPLQRARSRRQRLG